MFQRRHHGAAEDQYNKKYSRWCTERRAPDPMNRYDPTCIELVIAVPDGRIVFVITSL